MKFSLSVLTICGLLMVSSSASADVLLVDSIHQAPVNSSEGIPRPTRGMGMEQVKRQYGEPSNAHPWIGNPPITRWDYPEYSVFFEHSHVLTSVVHK